MSDITGKTLSEVSRMPGVADITPVMARGKFAQALMAEAKGERAQAGIYLDEAIAKL